MKITKYKNKKQRQAEVYPIIKKLNDLGLSPIYDSVKELYKKMNFYINSGERVKINIDFPEAKKQIIGVLVIGVNEKSYVKLKNY